ncbi:MAG: hypothetical protein WCS73_06375 [Lentisphaeria bacterium]
MEKTPFGEMKYIENSTLHYDGMFEILGGAWLCVSPCSKARGMNQP